MPTRHSTSRTALGWTCACTSHDEGGFFIPNNTITRRAATYTTNARFLAFLGTFACPAQQVWLPGNDLQEPATRRQRCCKCRRKPAASARRLPRQQPPQTRPSAAQPPPRGIQAESGIPPGVFQLSGPAHSAQAHSVATPSHPAAHQAMAPVQGPPPALRGHLF
jgi:hypothetical protein